MSPLLNESLAKRGIDLKSLKPGEIQVSGGSAQQTIDLQEGIDKELAKKNNCFGQAIKVKNSSLYSGR